MSLEQVLLALALGASSTSALGREVVATLYDATPNCRDSATRQHQICVEPSERIAGAPTLRVTTQNGNSRVLRQEPDPNNPSCFSITTEVVPNGESCVIGICNCRGNGWLGLEVHLQAAPK